MKIIFSLLLSRFCLSHLYTVYMSALFLHFVTSYLSDQIKSDLTLQIVRRRWQSLSNQYRVNVVANCSRTISWTKKWHTLFFHSWNFVVWQCAKFHASDAKFGVPKHSRCHPVSVCYLKKRIVLIFLVLVIFCLTEIGIKSGS